jgi:serine/threonine protein kinase
MAPSDAAGLAQLAIRLGLVDDEQCRECRAELDPSMSTPEALLRVMERKAFLTPWQGAKLLKGDIDGYFLGGYRLLYRISAGTFGRVYRADNPHTGEIVAIKVLRRKWSNDVHKIELFEREGKVGMTLRHPNLVRIIAVSKDPQTGQHFIVMEFVEGGNLRDIMTIRKKLAPLDAIRILDDAANGLAYAFSRGLTHRDIKLTNILLSTTGEAKLVDFGLAEITGPSANGGDDELNVDRTVDYAGLEKATGQKNGDIRSDIYFLGCTFYEMLTGEPLLSVTKDPKQRMMKHRFSVTANLRKDDPHLTGPVFSLLSRMTAFNPTERFQNPAQLVEAIRQTKAELTGEPRTDRLPTGPQSVFVVEHHPKLQDAFREKLKSMGYRVLISIDANRACERYAQQPFQAFIVDGGTTGEDGLYAMSKVMSEAGLQSLPCVGILILSEEQVDWAGRAGEIPNTTVLIRPVTMKQITTVLREKLPIASDEEEETESA